MNLSDNVSSNPLLNKSYVFLIVARMSNNIASQMLTVAVGWQIYSITKSTFYLGLVGLMQFLPMILLTLVAGHVADRYNRKFMVCISLAIESIGIFILAFGSLQGWINEGRILLIIFFIGIAGTFQGPPMQALLPNIVSKEIFPRATALMSSVSEFSVIIGPGLGGFLYTLGPEVVYFISGSLILLASLLISFIILRSEQQTKPEPTTLKTLFAGISFIRSKPVILGAISLDLFAVLFGGATALLPVYASEILKIGPTGLGILRSAPAVGALLTAALLARRPLRKRVGRTMFTAVIFFGISTIVFAVSKSFFLSLAALFVLGASDVISVVIRSTLVQTNTPDNMRGRVSAVNLMFIGTSNQFGEFESGITATLFGTVPAAMIGGIGTIVVV
ncbi:MAG: MFS transporter, partial [Bacillota bacterium]|nr:MFS transporter [Bacillota bacterium]